MNNVFCVFYRYRAHYTSLVAVFAELKDAERFINIHPNDHYFIQEFPVS